MNAIKVKRTELLDVLMKNREAHRKIFDEAQAGYRAAAISELDAMLLEARQGQRIRRAVSLVEPIDQTLEYDRAIAMLKMSVDDVIEVDPHDFQCYVLDQWQWKTQWATSNMRYSKSLQDAG